MTTLTMDNDNGDHKITEILLNKYKTLYNSVPTSDAELYSIKDSVNEGSINHQLQDILMTAWFVFDCVNQLKQRFCSRLYHFSKTRNRFYVIVMIIEVYHYVIMFLCY